MASATTDMTLPKVTQIIQQFKQHSAGTNPLSQSNERVLFSELLNEWLSPNSTLPEIVDLSAVPMDDKNQAALLTAIAENPKASVKRLELRPGAFGEKSFNAYVAVLAKHPIQSLVLSDLPLIDAQQTTLLKTVSDRLKKTGGFLIPTTKASDAAFEDPQSTDEISDPTTAAVDLKEMDEKKRRTDAWLYLAECFKLANPEALKPSETPVTPLNLLPHETDAPLNFDTVFERFLQNRQQLFTGSKCVDNQGEFTEEFSEKFMKDMHKYPDFDPSTDNEGSDITPLQRQLFDLAMNAFLQAFLRRKLEVIAVVEVNESAVRAGTKQFFAEQTRDLAGDLGELKEVEEARLSSPPPAQTTQQEVTYHIGELFTCIDEDFQIRDFSKFNPLTDQQQAHLIRAIAHNPNIKVELLKFNTQAFGVKSLAAYIELLKIHQTSPRTVAFFQSNLPQLTDDQQASILTAVLENPGSPVQRLALLPERKVFKMGAKTFLAFEGILSHINIREFTAFSELDLTDHEQAKLLRAVARKREPVFTELVYLNPILGSSQKESVEALAQLLTAYKGSSSLTKIDLSFVDRGEDFAQLIDIINKRCFLYSSSIVLHKPKERLGEKARAALENVAQYKLLKLVETTNNHPQLPVSSLPTPPVPVATATTVSSSAALPAQPKALTPSVSPLRFTAPGSSSVVSASTGSGLNMSAGFLSVPAPPASASRTSPSTAVTHLRGTIEIRTASEIKTASESANTSGLVNGSIVRAVTKTTLGPATQANGFEDAVKQKLIQVRKLDTKQEAVVHHMVEHFLAKGELKSREASWKTQLKPLLNNSQVQVNTFFTEIVSAISKTKDEMSNKQRSSNPTRNN